MALTVTSLTRENGPTCGHFIVEINDEGVTRTFKISESEIRDYLQSIDGYKKALVIAWLRYRKEFSRTLVGVPIA
jgi:hypothetical protein